MKWHPFAEKFPLMKDDDPAAWEEFVAGVRKTKGVKSDPVLYRIVGGEMQGLDGRNRYLACKQLKIKCDMKRVTVPDEEVVNFILRKNVHRRHMTRELRQTLVAELRAEGESIREIAAALKVHPSTVAKDITEAQASGVCAQTPELITGKDGKQYPATKPQADIGDANEDAPILCSRCSRIGTETPPGCEKCKAERQRIGQRKAERSTSKRTAGKVLWDWKAFNDGFGVLVRQIDAAGRSFQSKDDPEADNLRGKLTAFRLAFQAWVAELQQATK